MKLRKGGRATIWPWWQLEFRLFGRHMSFTVSRVRPKVAPSGDPEA